MNAFKTSKLKNGIRCLYVPVAGTQAVTVLVLCRVGSRYETEKISGASHFIEHLMFKGTNRRPSTFEISKALDSVGAEYNAATSKDWTGYYVKVSCEHLDLALDLLSDMVWDSKYEPAEFTREKGVIIEEINMYEDNPMMHVENLLEEAMFPGNTLGWNIAGTRSTMKNMKYQDLVCFRDRFYQPKNVVVAVAGCLPKKTPALVQKYFGSLKPKSKQGPHGFEKFNKFSSQAKPKCRIQYKKTEQVHLAMGFPGFYNEAKEIVPLQVLNVILGATMSSRLFIAVRERQGLAYYVRTGVESFEDTGIFEIRAGLDIKRFAQAAGIIKQELNKITRSGITNEELKRAKEFIRGKLYLELEDSAQQAEFYAKQMLLMKKIKTPEERLREFLRVSKGDVLKVAKKCLNWRQSAVAAVGPFKKAGDILKYF